MNEQNVIWNSKPYNSILIFIHKLGNNNLDIYHETQEKLIVQVQGGNIYTFRIRGPLEEIESKLKMLSFIKNVESIAQDNGVCSFRVKSDEGTNIEEELFQFAADNEWSLTELRRESMNLEDVFLHFTLPSSEEV